MQRIDKAERDQLEMLIFKCKNAHLTGYQPDTTTVRFMGDMAQRLLDQVDAHPVPRSRYTVTERGRDHETIPV